MFDQDTRKKVDSPLDHWLLRVRQVIAVICLFVIVIVSLPVRSMTVDEAQRILGIGPSPTESEIRGAYRMLSMRYHPDRFPIGTALEIVKANEELFKLINNAKEILLAKAASSSPRMSIDPFISRFGLIFHSPEQIARLKDYFANLAGQSSNVHLMVQTYSLHANRFPQLRSKLSEILVAVIEKEIPSAGMPEILEIILDSLKWEHSLLEAIVKSTIFERLGAPAPGIDHLRDKIFRHFLQIPITHDNVLIFSQFSKAAITPELGIQYWNQYTDLRGDPEFVSIVATTLLDGSTEFLENNIDLLAEVTKQSNDETRIYVFEILLEMHREVLDKHHEFIDMLREVTDFSSFDLHTFNALIYRDESKRHLGRILLEEFHRKNPKLFAQQFQILENLLSVSSVQELHENYADFLTIRDGVEKTGRLGTSHKCSRSVKKIK